MRGWIAGLLACGGLGAAVAMHAQAHQPPPPVQDTAYVVRMLDLTVQGMQDKNNTNRRQRFICKPAEEWGK